MNFKPTLTRRGFLRAAGALALGPMILPAPVWAAETSPNERLTMGFIGVGKQGRFLMDCFLPHSGVQIVAVCDVDTTRRESARKKTEEFYTVKADKNFKGCAAYKDYRELLARKDIDTVVIGSPDHWHALIATAACAAGKDVYCEKPLSLTIREARQMVEAARKHQRVFQTGSMQRSMPEFHKACQLVRNGRIGKIKQVICDVGGPSVWCDLPEEKMEPGLDWDMWLGPAPQRPYNSILSPRGVHDHFPNWRNYREYSGGMMTDWGAHHFDIAQWGLGMDDSGPVEIIPPEDPKATKGLRFKYANGVELIHGDSGGVLFVGETGKIFCNRGQFRAEPEALANEDLKAMPIQLYKCTNHYDDFVKAVRKRSKPICDVEIGARSASVCHLGNLAYWNHRKLKWDPAAEKFLGDDEANKWLDHPNRAPWNV